MNICFEILEIRSIVVLNQNTEVTEREAPATSQTLTVSQRIYFCQDSRTLATKFQKQKTYSFLGFHAVSSTKKPFFQLTDEDLTSSAPKRTHINNASEDYNLVSSGA